MRDVVQPTEIKKDSLQDLDLDNDSGASLTLADVGRMLGRHKWFIIICMVISIAVSVVYLKFATPIYEASGDIRIDPERASSLGLSDLTGGGSVSSSDPIATEIAIIKSDSVAIYALDSLSDDEFRTYSGFDKKDLAISYGATSLSPAQEGLLGGFKSQLGAIQIPNTQLVTISFRNPNAKIAATMVNSVISAYLQRSFDDRYGSVAQVKTYLNVEMDKLKEQAAAAQNQLSHFQEQNDIIGASSGNGPDSSTGDTTTSKLELLNSRLTQAEADRIVKEAQMRAVNSANPAVVASMYQDASVSALQADQGRLYAEYAQMSTKFGPNYPPLIDLRTQMRKVDDEFNKSVATIRSRAQQDYDGAVTIENMLRAQYDEQTAKAFAVNRKQAEYAVLKAQAVASRDLYNTLTVKLQQATVDAGLSGVNTMKVDTARAPLLPVEPKKTQILAFGFILGLFAGVAASFLIEAISDKVQGPEQVEGTLNCQVLATIPHISFIQNVPERTAGTARLLLSPMLVAYLDPQSREADAYRTIRNSVLLSAINNQSKTVLVTSTIPGEGKSSTAANYAVVLAQKGSRVLLIDADLRRPTLHKLFGVRNDEGLSSLLLESTMRESFKQPLLDMQNFCLLTAGRSINLPSESLGSNRFYSLLREWESQFDYIVIDSAPLLIVSDSHTLATWVDALILITRYNVTPISGLKRIRKVLSRTNANVVGVVVNDISESALGYYGGYGYDYYNN